MHGVWATAHQRFSGTQLAVLPDCRKQRRRRSRVVILPGQRRQHGLQRRQRRLPQLPQTSDAAHEQAGEDRSDRMYLTTLWDHRSRLKVDAG